jgi:hypothetical protein
MAKKLIGQVSAKAPDGSTVLSGGQMFDFRFLSAEDAVEVEVVIAGVATDGMIKLIAGANADENAQAEAAAAAVGSVAAALTRMGPGKTTEVMKKVFTSVMVDDESRPGATRPVDLNLDFTGRPKLKWAVFLEALKVNFADFFPGGLSPSIASLTTK